MKKTSTLLFLISTLFYAQAQDTLPKKGSYLYFGQPAIEDNSFLIEEAFNQETGIIQHISNFYFSNLSGGDFIYSYTQEIPLDDYRHQLSFTLNYPVIPRPKDQPLIGSQINTSGFGDILLNYRPLLWGKNDWALVIPRFTLIIPTGNSKDGFGSGGWGGQFNLAVTKRLGRKFVSHYNAGYTYIAQADRYNQDLNGNQVLSHEKNLNFYNLGTSLIWFVVPKFNLMLEGLANFESDIEENGQITKSNQFTLNPGFRFAFDIGKVQIVPGFGLPISFSKDNNNIGAFIYLSIEPDYNKK